MFHSLATSLTNVDEMILPPKASLSLFVSAALVLFSLLESFLLAHFVGWESELIDFHTSSNLIWALIWLTVAKLSSL